MTSNDERLEHFSVHGWMRVRAAFTAHEAAAMRAVIWRELAAAGITERDPATWTKERPDYLQHAGSDPAFRAVGSARLLEAIDAVLERRAFAMRFLLSGSIDLPAMWSRREMKTSTAG